MCQRFCAFVQMYRSFGSIELNAASLEWQKNKAREVWHWQRAGARKTKNSSKRSTSTLVITIMCYFCIAVPGTFELCIISYFIFSNQSVRYKCLFVCFRAAHSADSVTFKLCYELAPCHIDHSGANFLHKCWENSDPCAESLSWGLWTDPVRDVHVLIVTDEVIIFELRGEVHPRMSRNEHLSKFSQILPELLGGMELWRQIC